MAGTCGLGIRHPLMPGTHDSDQLKGALYPNVVAGVASSITAAATRARCHADVPHVTSSAQARFIQMCRSHSQVYPIAPCTWWTVFAAATAASQAAIFAC